MKFSGHKCSMCMNSINAKGQRRENVTKTLKWDGGGSFYFLPHERKKLFPSQKR